MIRLDLMRKTFDSVMLDLLQAYADDAVWTGVNAASAPDMAKRIVISGFLPGRPFLEELGGPEALVGREGVYVITQSLPKNTPVDDAWMLAGVFEERFRRTALDAHTCRVWCDEPYTENRGTEPETGRYLISTTIPWSVVH